MCYHWGLGVGHLHAHQSTSTPGCISNLAEDAQDGQPPNTELQEALRESPAHGNDRDSDMGYESGNPELCLEDRNFEGWDNIEMDDVLEDGDVDEGSDIEEPASEDDFPGM